jgi:hypothetical protein
MYTFVEFSSQILRRGDPFPTNKGVSYTNFMNLCILKLQILIIFLHFKNIIYIIIII